MAFVQQDSVFKTSVTRQATGEYVTTLEQTNRDIILERNRELRKNHGALKDLTFGRQVATIPLEDWEYFLRMNPDYRQMDAKQREAALFKFLHTDDRGKACMVVEENTNKKFHIIGAD